MDRLVVSLVAYVTVLVQVGLLAAWPLWGAVPHLIALGTVVFVMRREPRLGLWWIGVGGVLTDLLLPVPIGSTTVGLLLAFLLATLLLRHVVSDVSWWVGLILGGLLVAAAE
ncbi:rod shape-determining protein MreD, partial [Candidatus Berkelbacteria bacterium]|nr:rod shape-determining protein MreD [Candidatus Berkelbacteria bacterium]